MRFQFEDILLWAGLAAAAAVLSALATQLYQSGKLRAGRGKAIIVLRFFSLAALLMALGGLIIGPSVSHQEARLHVLVDRSLSMSWQSASVRQVLSSLSAWAKANGVALDFYAFHEELKKLKKSSEVFSVAEKNKTQIKTTLEALGGELDAGSAVVMLTDGVETEGLAAPRTALTVLPLAFGAGPASDLEIAEVRFPSAIFSRGEAPFRLILNYPAGLKDTLGVTIRDPKMNFSVWKTTLALTGLPPQEFELIFPVPRGIGPKNWELEINKAAWETDAANNRAEVRTEILREKLRVLYLAGQPSFDYGFLRELIRSQPSRELVSFVILRNPEDVPPYGETELSLIPFPAQEIFTQSLDEFDVFILQDFAFSRFALPFAYFEHIIRFVRSGGGFIFISGENVLKSAEYGAQAVSDFLGISLSGGEPFAGPMQWQVADPGTWNKIFTLHPDVDKNLETARERLSGVYAVYSGQDFSNSHPAVKLKDSQGREHPALVARSLDKGRVAWVGFSGSWSWKTSWGSDRKGLDVYDAFWEGLMKWASGEDAAGRSFQVFLDPERRRGLIRVTAVLEKGPPGSIKIWPGRKGFSAGGSPLNPVVERGPASTRGEPSGLVLGSGGKGDSPALNHYPGSETITITLEEKVSGSGIYEGWAPDLPAVWAAREFQTRLGGEVLTAKPSVLRGRQRDERRSRQDYAYLGEVAAANHGFVLGDAGQWAASVPAETGRRILSALKQSRERESWAGAPGGWRQELPKYLVLLASFILLVEWAWRRWSGITQ
ncbi:MAG: hypothetical protein HY401_01810 [Elusimicrobia bacterium]|nr:hypothetical protein [Elusimicrobiota bacterium]